MQWLKKAEETELESFISVELYYSSTAVKWICSIVSVLAKFEFLDSHTLQFACKGPGLQTLIDITNMQDATAVLLKCRILTTNIFLR